MKQQPTNFLKWCTKHAIEKVCRETLAHQRWRSGFLYPKCDHSRANQLKYISAHKVDQNLSSVHFVTSNFKDLSGALFRLCRTKTTKVH